MYLQLTVGPLYILLSQINAGIRYPANDPVSAAQCHVKPVTHRTYYFWVGNKPYKHQNLLIKGDWKSPKWVLMRNSSCGMYLPAQSFKGSSSHPEVALKFINRIKWQRMFKKTLVSVKVAPHISWNCCKDRDIILINWIYETFFFQRQFHNFIQNQHLRSHFEFWRENEAWERMDCFVKWNTFFTLLEFPPKLTKLFGKWKTPLFLCFIVQNLKKKVDC